MSTCHVTIIKQSCQLATKNKSLQFLQFLVMHIPQTRVYKLSYIPLLRNSTPHQKKMIFSVEYKNEKLIGINQSCGERAT